MEAGLVLVSRTEKRLEKMAEVVRSHGRRCGVAELRSRMKPESDFSPAPRSGRAEERVSD